MKKFVIKFFINLIPLLMIILGMEGIWFYNKELTDIDTVLSKQIESEKEVYYLRRDFSSNVNTYKMKAIDIIKPEILVIGTSRVLEFRNFMFTPFKDQFYTAGGSVQNIYDIVNFVDLMVEEKIHTPKLLFIGVDSWLLKEIDKPENSWIATNKNPDDVTHIYGHHNAFKYKFRKILFNGELPTLRKGDQGFGAYGKTGFGYRRDGSVHYNMFIEQYLQNPTYVDREDPPILERIVKKTHQFELPIVLSKSKEELLMEVVKKARDHGIEVVLFFPPFSDQCYDALENSISHESWWSYYKTLPAKFENLGFDVISYMRPADIGLDDRYMIDGYHPSEVMVATLFLKYLKRNHHHSELLKQIDTTYLEQRINNPKVLPISFMDG